MNRIKKWMETNYHRTTELCTIVFEGQTYIGHMYGSDECFDNNVFYQYFLTDTQLLKMYFTIPEGCDDYGDIDYDNPIDVIDDDAQDWIERII